MTSWRPRSFYQIAGQLLLQAVANGKTAATCRLSFGWTGIHLTDKTGLEDGKEKGSPPLCLTNVLDSHRLPHQLCDSNTWICYRKVNTGRRILNPIDNAITPDDVVLAGIHHCSSFFLPGSEPKKKTESSYSPCHGS
ncbi:hypothetical protein GE09DRAFT_443526 [Coniochaeta sp. 2T2.1]|nr:hypothetical protein GE09DRAFT_443526 [Coniochaeta sp. 2T2.1]